MTWQDILWIGAPVSILAALWARALYQEWRGER